MTAGWFELEHNSLGHEFGTFTDRFEKLEEALQIIGPMLRNERVSLDGKHYRVSDAIEHCERLNRDRSEIDVTCLQMVVIAPTTEEAEADMAEIAAVKGWNDEIIEMARSILVFGDADTVGEKLQDVMDAGLDGLTVDLPVNGHNLGRVALLGEIGLAVTAK